MLVCATSEKIFFGELAQKNAGLGCAHCRLEQWSRYGTTDNDRQCGLY